MERYIIFIPADGPCRLVACDDGDSIKLETLQELVDGPIEVTPSCLGASWAREPVDGINLIVNEEGRLRGLPYNGRASDLWEGGGICLLNGDALLAAAKGEDLIGFPKPVCRTICDEWELEMEDAHGTTDGPAVQRHQNRLLEHRQEGRTGAATRPV